MQTKNFPVHIQLFKEHIKRYALCLFMMVFAVSGLPGNAMSQIVTIEPAQPQKQNFADLPQNKRLRILIRMITSGAQGEAAKLLAQTPFSGKHAANRTLFLEGLIAKVNKDYKTAAHKFRAALANDPNLTLVRAQLAQVLYLDNQDGSAKHHLQLLANSAPSPDVAKQFDRFIDAINARRPWKASAYVSMAPSTNFTNGTTRQTIPVTGGALIIDSNSRKKSGIGLRGGANASYTFKPGKDLSLVVAAGVNFTQYKGAIFDDTIFSQSAALVRKHKKGQISIGATISQRLSGKNEFILEGGPFISITQRINNRVSVFAKLRHLRTDFKLANYRNGGTTTFDLRLSHAFSQSSVAYLLAGAQRTTTKRDHLDYWSGYAGAGLYKELTGGVTFYGEGKLTRKYYDGDFPLLGEPQTDTRFDMLVSLTKRDFNIAGFAPRIDYTYTKSMSNSVFSEYSTHGANVSLTKAF